MKLSLSFTLWFLFQITSSAGVSVAREQAVELIKKNPEVQPHLLEFLDLAPVGEATRLGRHFGPHSGAAVGPYQFEARLKNSPGSNWPLILTLNTKISFTDPAGNVIQGVPSAEATDLTLHETLVSALLKVHSTPNPAPNPPLPDSATPPIPVKKQGKTHQLSWDTPKKQPVKKPQNPNTKQHIVNWEIPAAPQQTPPPKSQPGVKRQIKLNWDQPGQNKDTRSPEPPLTKEQKKIKDTIKRTYYSPQP